MEDEKKVKLTMPIDMSDILKGKLSQFKISVDEDEDRDVSSFINSEDEEEDDEMVEKRDVQIKTRIDLPFSLMKKTMSLIDRGIYKEIITEGSGDLVPESARIQLDYCGFCENKTSPFESTWVNRRRARVQKIDDDMLPGLYFSLLTMRQGEEAKFIIPYQLLYGVLGCEVIGVPQRADCLYIIKLISFEDVGDSTAIDDKYIDQYEPYDKVLERVVAVRKSARCNFGDGKFDLAANEYKKCITALKFCRDANEEERKKLIEQLYVNVCVCYNKLDRPKEVLRVSEEFMDNLKTNCKAMFQVGRAHFKLSNYVSALHFLCKAQQLEPNNKEIAQEMKLVDEVNSKYKEDMKEISQKAFQVTKNGFAPKKVNMKDNKSFKLLEAYVKKFVDDPKKTSQLLPVSLNPSELELVQDIANSYNLKIDAKNENSEQWRYLVKEKQAEPEAI